MSKIIFIAIIVFELIVGALYIIKGKKQTDIPSAKQHSVKKNRGIFGVSNKGTTMDSKQIYTIKYESLGIK